MQLKQDILDVLAKYGAEPNEIAALVEYFASRAVEADASVAVLEANIASLQQQLAEETARANRTKAGVAKFVAIEEAIEPIEGTA